MQNLDDVKRHWNYRVIYHDYEEFTYYAIHEVHYENDKPAHFNVKPAIVMDESKEELADILEMMKTALGKPALTMKDFDLEDGK